MNKVGGFRGDGAFGQLCIVLPEHQLVVAATAACRSMQDELNWIWEMVEQIDARAIEDDPEALARLRQKLASLEIDRPDGAPVSGALAESRTAHSECASSLLGASVYSSSRTFQYSSP